MASLAGDRVQLLLRLFRLANILLTISIVSIIAPFSSRNCLQEKDT